MTTNVPKKTDPDRLPREIASALALGRAGNVESAILTLVRFALEIGTERAEALVSPESPLLELRQEFSSFYQTWIVGIERAEAEHVMRSPLRAGQKFRDAAGVNAAVAYDRVEDVFTYCEFEKIDRFVLVGAGHLPVTALHVHDRTAVTRIDCIDIQADAAAGIERLSQWCGSKRIRAHCDDGQNYDFGDADVVYIANMVSPKPAVIRRALEPAPAHPQIIVREPYSLGCLWAEKTGIEDELLIGAKGRGSPFLSRDIF